MSATLLLLHGVGATRSAWGPLLAHLDWPGDVLAPDLTGHGGAGRLPAYDVPAVAAAVAASLPPGRVAVLGHSFGGAVGMALATASAQVTAVVALGVKAAWTDADVERFASLAARPPRVFATRDEAIARHLAMAGLTGQPADEHADGVAEVDGGWALALDPVALAQRSPDFPGLVAAAARRGVRVTLLRGADDAMVSHDELTACPAPVVDLPGLGHNAHVEDPAAVWTAARPFLG